MRSLTLSACAVFFLLSIHAQCFALSPPQNKTEYCELAKNPKNFQSLLAAPENRLSFRNKGGLFNGGVCWWHSRLQRSLTYLTVFLPHEPKPLKNEVKRILAKIRKNKDVVEIPGYTNVHDFTRDWEDVIQKTLNQWQARDGFINQAWVRGVSGSTRENADRLEAQMQKLYREVEESNRITYIKLQIRGIVSHALLVLRMLKTSSGFDVYTIDSNSFYLEKYSYQKGDGYFSEYDSTIFVEQTKDFKKISKAMESYCSG